ncbi:hypothetical protein TNIN_64331 [Trichonephila inaurata madagascariensis]|uniref:Uncharacterized protein n=1 Tax=Trichonephila inaurata madagascariensis TaxID=2747483 RepID=A0A8X7C2M5_9ARAC|nr:hypothetical protein TNIN_64331 [Trichonephila inaurata madagascariensis]
MPAYGWCQFMDESSSSNGILQITAQPQFNASMSQNRSSQLKNAGAPSRGNKVKQFRHRRRPRALNVTIGIRDWRDAKPAFSAKRKPAPAGTKRQKAFDTWFHSYLALNILQYLNMNMCQNLKRVVSKAFS